MRRKPTKFYLALFPLILILLISGCSQGIDTVDSHLSTENQKESQNVELVDKVEIVESVGVNTKQEIPSEQMIKVKGDLELHFIDVGQGDSVLIKQGEYSMLIDAGDNGYGEMVVEYLRKLGVSKLDYVIGTHPHSDHIGGLDDVINAFDIGKVIMPKVTHTSKTFEDVVVAIKNKGLKITTPVVGDTYSLGEALFTILGPSSSEYNNLNNYSVITKLSYGDNDFLFTGDAEEESERELIGLNTDISANVFSLGHHGSSTSNLPELLNLIYSKEQATSYAIIQVGEDNNYGHPHREVLESLTEKNIEVYRNDLHGTIKIVSDGFNISIETEKENKGWEDDKVLSNEKNNKDIQKKEDISNERYIGNKNSKVFHRENCRNLPAEHNRMYLDSKEEALQKGFRACGNCKP